MLSGTGHVCRVAQIMPGMSFHVGRTIRPEMFAFAVQDALLDGDFMDYAAAEACVIGRNPRTGRPAVRAENGVEWYDVLVLPAAEYVPYATLEKALAFAKAGSRGFPSHPPNRRLSSGREQQAYNSKILVVVRLLSIPPPSP